MNPGRKSKKCTNVDIKKQDTDEKLPH